MQTITKFINSFKATRVRDWVLTGFCIVLFYNIFGGMSLTRFTENHMTKVTNSIEKVDKNIREMHQEARASDNRIEAAFNPEANVIAQRIEIVSSRVEALEKKFAEHNEQFKLPQTVTSHNSAVNRPLTIEEIKSMRLELETKLNTLLSLPNEQLLSEYLDLQNQFAQLLSAVLTKPSDKIEVKHG